MSANASPFANMPPQALAANWPPEIIEEYMASIQKDHERGVTDDDDDDMMSTDSEGTSSEVSEMDTTEAPEMPRPDDIASADSAFSSEDEFTTEEVRTTTRLRRALVLGRPTPELLRLHHKDLVGRVEGYMTELNDADVELAELAGTTVELPMRRPPSVEYRAPGPWPQDPQERERMLRTMSQKEVIDCTKAELLELLPLLAQALFRKERLIKHTKV